MRQSRVIVLLTLIGCQILSIPAWADENAEKAAAQKATEAWLALVDTGKYAESWDQAAELFRKRLTKEQWVKVVEGVRSPLGKLESRKLTTAEYSTTMQGAPDGEYVVTQFQSAFANKKSAVETLVAMKDKDGQWHCSGYLFK